MIRLPSLFQATCLATCLAALAAGPARADSSVASSASDSVSTSFAGLSDSLAGSSNSSSPGQHRAEGDYKVIEVAEVPDRPGLLRLRLEPLPEGREGELQLTLPRAAAEAGHVGRDTVVTALPRPYGVAFAAGPDRAAFFLALDDTWMRELRTTAVEPSGG